MTAEQAVTHRAGIWKRLPWPAWLSVGLAVTLVVAEMAGGFAESFTNLDRGASAAGWDLPWILPLAADAPILAYVILGQVAVFLGARARSLNAVAWGLAAFSVWANYEVAPASSQSWRLIYAAMPLGWVLGVEGLRWFWRLLHAGPAQPRDRIPFGRWIAAPLETRRIQWRMWKLGETSWKRMSAIEDARSLAIDVVRELGDGGRRVAPGYLSDRIRAARLPGPVLDAIDTACRFKSGSAAIEAAVRDWVAGQMVLTEWAKASLMNAQAAVARATAEQAAKTTAEDPAGETAEPVVEQPARRAAARPARTPSTTAAQRIKRMGIRRAPDDLIKDAIRDLLAGSEPVTTALVVRTLGMGDRKAGRLLDEVKAEPAEPPHLAAVTG